MIDGKNGLLPLLTFDATDGWDELLKLAKPELDNDGLQRLMKAVSSSTRTVAIERHYIDRDYRDTFHNFHSKRFTTPNSRCLRLHFFSHSVTREDIKSVSIIQPHYLGYSVIRPTKPNCVGRTLLSCKSNTAITGAICRCKERVSLQGTELEVEGFPFISQDVDVTVCAQSALWMLVRYYSNKYPVYAEKYPFELSKLTEDYSLGRIAPSSGLYIWQMAEALRRLGFGPVIYSRKKYPVDFDRYLYTYIESGIPVLAATEKHVMVAFGHKSDYSPSEIPAGQLSFSSQFNTAFIVNDDNRTPYQLLRKTKQNTPDESEFDFNDIISFVAPLAGKIFLPAESFEAVVTKILNRGDVGYHVLSPTLTASPLLLRLFLTSAKSFKKRLAERGMGAPLVEEVYRSLPLPHFVWVCEIAHHADYQSPHKIWGEIVWDATRNAEEPDGWIAVHYPEFLIVDQGSAENHDQQLQKFPLQNSQKYPVYQSNLYDTDHIAIA